MLRQSNAAAQVLATALVGVAAVSMIMRLRRAKESNVNSSICWPSGGPAYWLLSGCLPVHARDDPPHSTLLDTAVSGLSLVVVPAAIGMTILRYRLYDLDRLINRTLVYGLLTVLLGLGDAASVLVFGQLAGRDQIQPRRGRRHPDRRHPVQPA